MCKTLSDDMPTKESLLGKELTALPKNRKGKRKEKKIVTKRLMHKITWDFYCKLRLITHTSVHLFMYINIWMYMNYVHSYISFIMKVGKYKIWSSGNKYYNIYEKTNFYAKNNICFVILLIIILLIICFVYWHALEML